jgi:hypothetical protein
LPDEGTAQRGQPCGRSDIFFWGVAQAVTSFQLQVKQKTMKHHVNGEIINVLSRISLFLSRSVSAVR